VFGDLTGPAWSLATGAAAAVNKIRDPLDCAWPAVLAASPSPFRL
jgi:hypothetical protein